jgi:deoxyribonuclease-4
MIMALSYRFGTVGSPISTPKKPGGSLGAIQRIRELNLDAFELGWVQSVRVSEATCAEIKKAAIINDVHLSVHAPYFINLNANAEEWPKSRKRLMDSAIYGNLAGATDIIFHPGSYFGQPASDVLKISNERLGNCVDELKTLGIQVILRPETMGKSAMLGSFEDTLEMAKVIPQVLPCLDFAHLHARTGNGGMNTYDEWCRSLDKYGKTLGQDYLNKIHIHLSGIEYSIKGERNHLPIQESDLNLKDLFRALVKFQTKGRILCESPILEEDALYMQQTWQDISGEEL